MRLTLTHSAALLEIERLNARLGTLERQLLVPYRLGRCVYCAAPCRFKVCSAHSDLAALDPFGPDRRAAA